MAGRATSYTDYYKKTAKTPGTYGRNDDEEQPYENKVYKTKPVASRSPFTKAYRTQVEDEEENNKMAAIKRRLSVASSVTKDPRRMSATLRRRS